MTVVTPILRELHWLPVDQRIVFNILLFTFKALHHLAPFIQIGLTNYLPSNTQL